MTEVPIIYKPVYWFLYIGASVNKELKIFLTNWEGKETLKSAKLSRVAKKLPQYSEFYA